MSGQPGVPQFHRQLPRENTSWMNYAACQGISDPDIFFDPEYYRYAQLICLECTVTEQCKARRRPGDTGVWGGRVYEGKNPRYNKNATDDEDFPHGSERGYKRHVRSGGASSACGPCRQAASRTSLDRQHRRNREA